MLKCWRSCAPGPAGLGCAGERADFVHTLPARKREPPRLTRSASRVRMPGSWHGLAPICRPGSACRVCLTAPQAECRRDDGRQVLQEPLDPSRAQGRGSAGRAFFGTYNFAGQQRNRARVCETRCEKKAPAVPEPWTVSARTRAEICVRCRSIGKRRQHCRDRTRCQNQNSKMSKLAPPPDFDLPDHGPAGKGEGGHVVLIACRPWACSRGEGFVQWMSRARSNARELALEVGRGGRERAADWTRAENHQLDRGRQNLRAGSLEQSVALWRRRNGINPIGEAGLY